MEQKREDYITLQEEIWGKVSLLSKEIDAAKIILEQITKLNAAQDLDRAIDDMLETIGLYMNAERMYVYEKEDECYLNTHEWCPAKNSEKGGRLRRIALERLRAFTKTLQKGECVVVSDPEEIRETMPGMYDLMTAGGVTGIVEAPIMMGERLMGFLGVDNAPKEITSLIMDSLSGLGAFLGTAMQIRQERKNIERQNAELDKERKTYRNALSNQCVFCYSFDVTEGMIREEFVSSNGINLVERLDFSLPVSFDELNAKFLADFQIRLLSEKMATNFTSRGLLDQFQKGVTNVESEYYSPVTDAYTRTSALLSLDETTGHVYAFVMGTDTTAPRKKEEEQFQELFDARERLKAANVDMNLRMETIMQGISGGFKISKDDEVFSYEYVSEGAAMLQGYTVGEFMEASGGSPVANCYPPDVEATLCAVTKQYAAGDAYSVKYRVRHKDGSLKWIMDSGKKVVDAEGVVHHYSLLQDVTELEERNIALRDANDMQTQILSSISCGVFAYTVPDRRLIVINDVAKRIIECDETSLPSDFVRYFMERVVPEDREQLKKISYCLKTPGDSTGYRYRVRRMDGTFVVVQSYAKLLQFSDGKMYVLSSLLDITEQTELEMLLSMERGQYRDAMLEGAELSFAVDLTDGYLRDSIRFKGGEMNPEQMGFSLPAAYDDIVSKWVEIKHIAPFGESSDTVRYRKKLLDHYYGTGESRVEAEYYSTRLDQYYNILVLLSKMKQDGHVHAIFIAYNKTAARKEEERQKHQLIEAKENLSAVNKELKLSLQSEKEKTAVIGAMSNIYYYSYLVDMGDETLSKVSDQNPEIYLASGGKAREAFAMWIDGGLDESFRDEVRAFTDLDTLSDRMRDTQLLNQDCISRQDGWVRISFIAVSRDLEGNLWQALFVAQHIDAEKQRELSQQMALKTAYDAANRANSAKTDFLASMSHDIRTPMNAIIGMTAIAGTHLEDKERVSDCLNKITVASKHLLGLINEVLDMSKIESGKMDLYNEEFSLPELIDNLLIMVKPQVKAKGHELSVSIRGIEHEKVIGDSQRIQQSFMNLMSNAVKYTPDGGKISLSISEKPTNKTKVGCYEFIFEDNGIGMSEDFISHLFEPFARATDSRVEKIQGTGLGMAITNNMVQMMNGNIKVESELDKGTRITVTIIMKLQDEGEEISYEEFVDLPILVADDDQIACESTCEVLGELGMKGEWVLSGQEAVALTLKRHQEENDFFAVIIDWQMPGMDGIETTREIRKAVGDKVPIIIISAYDWSDIELEARAAGADAFISKPLFKSRMAHLFNELLGHGREEIKEASLNDIIRNDYEGKRALLVEDNEINAEIAGEILHMAGLLVDRAKDGREALNIMSTVDDDYYDIIFMDIQMPVMNGYDATAAIRALPGSYTKRVPIIAMTANAFTEDVQSARAAGMNQHMAKPLDFGKLMDTLDKWLKTDT